MPQIVVHEKALAHLSRGLYRSPASALRELVSNAWDANASHVLITTNYPHFAQIAVQDNGDGFSKDEFARLMGGGIGNSEKRQSSEPRIAGRPLIGRLGIGMLGIAQICGSFEVSSKPKQGKAFRAQVHLYDLIREQLDENNPDIVKGGGGTREVDVGEYHFVDLDDDALSRGTRITSDDVHPTFIRSFRESLKLKDFREPPLDWSKCLKVVSAVHTLHELGDYWKLLWELAAACPVPYIGEDSVPQSAIRGMQQRLIEYDFTVRVDGIPLRKPVHLRGNVAGYTVEKIPAKSWDVYGRKLDCEGYVVVQEGKQLQPDELRGIMIRIKNVGVGYYDGSFLDYPFNEGPRAKWVTGEIFVQAGLEDALNIDRDSFNRFHPEFRTLQKYVHSILRGEVFPAVYRKLTGRSARREAQRIESRAAGLKEVVSASLGAAVKVRQLSMGAGGEPVSVEKVGEQVQITFGDVSELRTSKRLRQLAATILALYEIAAYERGEVKRREQFEKLLLELLSRW
jgi:hypothetical protein